MGGVDGPSRIRRANGASEGSLGDFPRYSGAGVWAGDPIFRRQVKAAGLTFSTSCSYDLRATWSTPLSERHLRRVVGDSRTTTTIRGAPPFCHYPMP
jgi:hypothetical protein